MASLKCSEDLKKLILNTCYPIGHIWVSMNSTNPKDIVGGEWTQIKGSYLCAVDTNTTMAHKDVLKKFGAWSTNEHAITVDQMPNHTHTCEVYIDKYPQGGYDKFIAYGNPQGTTYYTWGMSSTGGGKGHSHTFSPPSITTYMWYRTA